MKIDWRRKLTSRKLWMSIASFVGNILVAAGVSNNTITQVTAIIMAGASAIAYVVAEGLTDAKGTGKTEAVTERDEKDDE